MLFTAASALCGLAWSLPALVAFRMLQGLGGGAIIPTAQTILFARYPKAEHGMAAGLFGLAAITGPLLGPSIGGYLIDIASWHWIFYVNVPIGIVAAVLVLRFVEQPSFKPPVGRRGEGSTSSGSRCSPSACPRFSTSSRRATARAGSRAGPSSSSSVVAAIALITFIVHELETPRPVMDLRVFANRSYAAGTGLNFLTGFALFSGSYLFSLFGGAVMHYTALDLGRVFLVAGTVSVVRHAGHGAHRAEGRRAIPALHRRRHRRVRASSSASHLTREAGFWDLVRPNMIRSFGLGFIFIPVSVLALSDLPDAQRGNATGSST